MGKKKRVGGGDLIAQQTLREQAWCYARRMEGYTFPMIRALANEPADAGGLGYDLSVSAIRSLVQAHREAQGEITGTRAERIERRQMLYEGQILRAQAAISRAAAVGALDPDAEKLLQSALAAEAKMHGDDAAQRIEADVTHHDGATAELFAMLDEVGIDYPEKADR
jgi:hypothetical protein